MAPRGDNGADVLDDVPSLIVSCRNGACVFLLIAKSTLPTVLTKRSTSLLLFAAEDLDCRIHRSRMNTLGIYFCEELPRVLGFCGAESEQGCPASAEPDRNGLMNMVFSSSPLLHVSAIERALAKLFFFFDSPLYLRTNQEGGPRAMGLPRHDDAVYQSLDVGRISLKSQYSPPLTLQSKASGEAVFNLCFFVGQLVTC